VLTEWYGENAPARGSWRIAGRIVDAARCAMPSLVVVPAQDRIVPPGSARALGTALPFAETWTPSLGHIGMVVSREAPRVVWEPLRDWLLVRAEARPGARRRRRPARR
jgi:polyhydroxyalkanoate synthase